MRLACTLLASGTLALFSAPIAAQEPSNTPTAPPVNSAPSAGSEKEAQPPGAASTKTDDQTTTSECKGLEEKPCRTNKVCTWIIPKEPNKTGEVPPAYCRKLGPTKKRPKSTGAGEVSPAPSPEKKQPATSAPPP